LWLIEFIIKFDLFFGTFNVREKTPRRGRNPQTGEEMEISARRVITFKPSNILKSTIGEKSD